MKTTTKDLIAAIAERGVITEQEINLLKRRANEGDEDVSMIYDHLPIPVTAEQAGKAIKWLRGLHYTPTGKERANSPYGYREIAIIDSDQHEVTFNGFYDTSRWRGVRANVPLYWVDGMEFYVSGGQINIVG